ncbi:hypothetical protein XENOCAPTIV_026495, partial [Xenoophorus captivus]
IRLLTMLEAMLQDFSKVLKHCNRAEFCFMGQNCLDNAAHSWRHLPDGSGSQRHHQVARAQVQVGRRANMQQRRMKRIAYLHKTSGVRGRGLDHMLANDILYIRIRRKFIIGELSLLEKLIFRSVLF